MMSHDVRPVIASVYREGKSLPGDIDAPWDYPLIAICAEEGCTKRIRVPVIGAEWKHAMTSEQIASIVHQANRRLQHIQGDPNPSEDWDDETPELQRTCIEGVEQALLGAGPEELHAAWVEHLKEHGWTWGPVKDRELKQHPCLCPYAQLPANQQLKDALFLAIVGTLTQDLPMQLLTMIDGTHADVGNIPESSPTVGGYMTGTPDIQWTPADWSRFPHSAHVRINQGYQAIHVSMWDVADVERGALTPADIPPLVHDRIGLGITWTTIYGSDSTLAAVHDELKNAPGTPGWFFGHVDCWLVNVALNEAEAGRIVGTEVHGLTCRAVQWADPQSNPDTIVPGSTLTLAQANLDLDVADATWHHNIVPPPPVQRILGVTEQLGAIPLFSRDGGRTYTRT